ncbi:UbiA family prenyltransferase [Polystyrenella longa]|nr:UbiA family prenyltransferase [Polystyrenella longa]
MSLRPWFQLVRLPALFSAWSNIWLGYLLTHEHLLPVTSVLLLMLSSTGLYLAGMAFNDYFDRHIDAKERPFRPIPSGAICPKHALALSVILMLVGFVAASFVSLNSLYIALAISASVLLYDAGGKVYIVGPILMGLCRYLNVLLGASLAINLWEPGLQAVALLSGLYVLALTWFGRNEAEESSPVELKIGTLALGFVALLMVRAVFFWYVPANDLDDTAVAPFPIHRLIAFAGLMAVFVLIGRKIIAAIRQPSPAQVQLAMRTLLTSIIFFDAIYILAFHGCYGYAIATACLFLPAKLIGRRLYVT